MPRYYCDYCDTHLTHDSPSVRKQHCAGYKHKANVRQYYQQFEEQQTQSLIDQKVKEHLGQTAAALAQQQVGGAVYSHLSSLGGQYKPMPAPGLLRPPVLAPVRPPVLQPPTGGPSPGYGSGAPPSFRPPVALPPGSAPPQYYSSNGPSQMQYSTSNGAPQYSVNNSSVPQSYSSSSSGGQSQYMSNMNGGGQGQYQASSGGSQEQQQQQQQQQYSNGPTRVPLPSTYNQGPVYQR